MEALANQAMTTAGVATCGGRTAAIPQPRHSGLGQRTGAIDPLRSFAMKQNSSGRCENSGTLHAIPDLPQLCDHATLVAF
jgi:hypothetical protein